MPEHKLMCLKCGHTGHSVASCSSQDWRERVSKPWHAATRGPICSRCVSLDLIGRLETEPAWESQSDLTSAFNKGHGSIQILGLIGSLELWSDCPVCILLFNVIPSVASIEQEVLLVPDWTINRVAGELGAIRMDRPEKRAYSTCLTLMLKPNEYSLPAGLVAHRGDAFCLLERDIPPRRALGGRVVPWDGINVSMVRDWISTCAIRHDDQCSPVATDDLDAIRLIDVHSREIVSYPTGCSYIALSYVWGQTIQKAYRLGDTVAALPRTLEDALTLTADLGERYLWIDSVCIDQSNPTDKKDQIDRMWSIYRGAYLTVIILSGTSADAGISRMSRHVPKAQVVCSIGSKTVATLAPTLSLQIWTRPWGQRAWTLQEGLLSPRCLYISDEQCYFDCSAMQCCETLDESGSWAHNLTPASNPTGEGFVTWMLRQAGAGALRVPLDWPERRLEHWGEKLNLYSYRNMKFNEDAIRAFAGVLQRLETIYPKGFFCGLPREDFDWALLWRPQVPQERREGFPTWSWAGWRGPLFFGQPRDITQTRRWPTPLLIETFESGSRRTLFDSASDCQPASERLSILISNDPVDKAARNAVAPMPSAVFFTEQHDLANAILVTAVSMRLTPDFGNPQTKTYQAGAYETFAMEVEGVDCLLRITSTDYCIPAKWVDSRWIIDESKATEWNCLLIARDHIQGFILHHLMLIEATPDGSAFERKTVFELLVPLDDLKVLEYFHLSRSQVLLV